jgi:hypothetical protein
MELSPSLRPRLSLPLPIFQTTFCHVAQVGLELSMLLPPPPECLGLQACSSMPGCICTDTTGELAGEKQ